MTRFDRAKLRTNATIQLCEQFGEKSSCPQNNAHSFLCASYQAKTYNGWKNPHCGICSDAENQLNEHNVCTSTRLNEHIEMKFGYSVVVSLGGEMGCRPGTVWDTDIGRCSFFMCGIGYEKHKSKCKKILETKDNFEGNTFDTCLKGSTMSLLLREKPIPWPVDSIHEHLVSTIFDYVLNSYYNHGSLKAKSHNVSFSTKDRLKYPFKLLWMNNLFISNKPL